MGTPITNLYVKLYRNDKENPFVNGEIQKIDSFDTESPDKVENNVYTYSTTFNAPQDSSFGLDGEDNAFRVGVYAKDAANEAVTLLLDNLEDYKSESANVNDFIMKVRVKERTLPFVTPDTKVWGNYHNKKEFTAHFIAYDQNNNYRLAGINTDKSSMQILLDNVPQDSNLLEIEDIEVTNDNYPQLVGQDNGEAYYISYDFVLEEGTYTIGLKVSDNDGNTFLAEKNITIKTSVPSIALEAPSADNPIYGLGRPIEIKGTVDTPSKIYVTILKKDINGEYSEAIIQEELIATTSTAGEAFSKDYSSLVDGEYKVVVKAVDINYESAYSEETATFIKDTLSPRFLSVKFYPTDENGNVNGEATKEFVSGTVYKIVIEVE